MTGKQTFIISHLRTLVSVTFNLDKTSNENLSHLYSVLQQYVHMRHSASGTGFQVLGNL